jgi:hypothetical protein
VDITTRTLLIVGGTSGIGLDLARRFRHSLVAAGERRRPRPRRARSVPPRLLALLESIGVPAFIEDPAFDVLAANALATALSPRLRAGENRLRSLMLDTEEQEFQKDWAASAAGLIAAFREQAAGDPSDPRFVELVGELSLASGRFRELWARHDVRLLSGGDATVIHPQLGELRLHREKLPVDGLLLVVYYADRDSESAQKLALLGALTAPDLRP